MNAKEQWIDKAMGSLDGAGQAGLSPDTLGNILNGIQATGSGNELLKFSQVWKIAAIILLLVSLNVFTMVYCRSSSGNSNRTTLSVASEYFSYMDNYNL